jgi:hypothetical protein
MRIVVLAAALAGLAPSTAGADVSARSPLSMPGTRIERSVGLELMVGTMSSTPSDLTLIGLELDVEYPLSERLGFRALLPLAHERSDASSGTSLGNLTVGLDHPISSPADGRVGWSIGGDLSVPTASDEGNSAIAAIDHSILRIPYPGRYAPDTSALRFYGNARIERETVFAQVQLAGHYLLVEDADDLTLIKLALGGGAMVNDRTAVLGELTTVSDIVDDSEGENFIHLLELGLRHRADRFAIGGRIHLPLDDTFRSRQIIGFAVEVEATY